LPETGLSDFPEIAAKTSFGASAPKTRSNCRCSRSSVSWSATTPTNRSRRCFLRKRATGERFASKQRRDELLLKLKEFESVAGRGVEARRRRSRIVSFLSHNGVLMY